MAPSLFYAQKRVNLALPDNTLTGIVIDAEQCFQVVLETGDPGQVVVEAEMEGEYQGDILVKTEILGNTLHIGTGFSPIFERPNDKLSAHKVLSVRLRVHLPPRQSVTVNGQRAEIRARGDYRNLTVRVVDGSCQLRHTAEQTRVQTGSARIEAWVERATVEAYSRSGEVRVDPIPDGNGQWVLSSHSGDIRVNRQR
ncbi:hypothetical protein OZ410_05005 [Robiginitalea sp. M366]|uniref:hypothetical protein n=1 Tax=Robiginitalea aestuariiviva TaxID=3036903 RepID=UPI00240DD9E4|nr:hypothetical protein [Robiginitalea aestuariiviva]MDG1571662.1 hypothetical protein [Robiginitalea aestuariiviva]